MNNGIYTIYHQNHSINRSKPNSAIIDEKDDENDLNNKLWLIVRKIQISDSQSNAFYLTGGERIKLGRVVIKILEVNSEQA